MKKLLIVLFAVIAGFGSAYADDITISQAVIDSSTNTTTGEKIIISYDPLKHRETASNIFMGWAGLSAGAGLIFAFSTDSMGQGIGIGTLAYGIVETAMAVIDKNWGEKYSDPEKSRLSMVEDTGWHAVMGLVQVLGGAALAMAGNNDVKGYGIAMALQGTFLSISDGMNHFIANDPKNIRTWNADAGIYIPLAGLDF
ncbi:MAG: hypothetical protein LLG37_10470 [Spirochaetia bacterium]|nr:hypothetical protein [Spirochaetia bacterium]